MKPLSPLVLTWLGGTAPLHLVCAPQRVAGAGGRRALDVALAGIDTETPAGNPGGLAFSRGLSVPLSSG